MAESIVVSVTDSRTSSNIVSLQEVKNYLRVDNTDDDNEIQDMIDNSIDAVEVFLEKDIFSKQRRMYLSSVDCDFNLFYAPINTTSSFTVNINGEDTDAYELQGIEDPLIVLEGYPSIKINILYETLGITDLSKIKQGIKSRVAWLYYGRDAKMPTNWKGFLSPYRRYGYYGTR